MIDLGLIQAMDDFLDVNTGRDYREQPRAQDWARVAKLVEEAGEAVSELIVWTGQNPRKPRDHEAYGRMLQELADTAMTGMLAIQHFTKDVVETQRVMDVAQDRGRARLAKAGYEFGPR